MTKPLADDNQPVRVFISYSHDSPDHEDRVLALADRLREDEIDAEIDLYEQAPAEGWPLWCERQIEAAEFVLLVCTDTYQRRVKGEELHGVGLGVLWEANIIRQHLYQTGGVSDKFIPVLFSDGSPDHIPTTVKGFPRYTVDTDTGYEALYSRLIGQPLVTRPQLGPLKRLPPRTRRNSSSRTQAPAIAPSSEYSALPPPEALSWPSEDLIRKALASLWTGHISFNVPAQMKQGRQERIEVRITRDLSEALTQGLRGRGKPQIETVRVGTFMSARLAGETFEISPLNSEEGQVVPAQGFAQWSWNVRPTESGTHTLQLIVTVRMKIGGVGEEPLDSPVIDKEIRVSIAPVYAARKFAREHKRAITAVSVVLLGSPVISEVVKHYIDAPPPATDPIAQTDVTAIPPGDSTVFPRIATLSVCGTMFAKSDGGNGLRTITPGSCDIKGTVDNLRLPDGIQKRALCFSATIWSNSQKKLGIKTFVDNIDYKGKFYFMDTRQLSGKQVYGIILYLPGAVYGVGQPACDQTAPGDPSSEVLWNEKFEVAPN